MRSSKVVQLRAAPLTPEDWDILVNHRGDAERAYFMGWRLGINRAAARRDAALMLKREEYKTAFSVMSVALWFEDLGDDVPDGCWK